MGHGVRVAGVIHCGVLLQGVEFSSFLLRV